MAEDGDIRVQIAMNIVLSAVLSTVAVWGLAFVGPLTFSWPTVAGLTLILVVVTYAAVLR